jgi:hypothetical protein
MELIQIMEHLNKIEKGVLVKKTKVIKRRRKRKTKAREAKIQILEKKVMI